MRRRSHSSSFRFHERRQFGGRLGRRLKRGLERVGRRSLQDEGGVVLVPKHRRNGGSGFIEERNTHHISYAVRERPPTYDP